MFTLYIFVHLCSMLDLVKGRLALQKLDNAINSFVLFFVAEFSRAELKSVLPVV